MASTWQSIISSPTFNEFSPEKQIAVRRDYFNNYTTPEDLQVELARLSTLHGVDPSLTKAIASIESNWDAKAKSPKGATGIMQLMPPTAGDRARDMGMDVEEVLSNPSFNMEAGVRHLKYLLNRYNGDMKKAAQAYNWGEGNLERKGELASPQETKDYISKLEKKLGRVPTTADVPYGEGIVGKGIVKPVEGEADLETIRNIDTNLFAKEGEPSIPLTYKNTEKEVEEVPFIRGRNKDNTFDIVTKPTISAIPEVVGPPLPQKRDIPHSYEKYRIPSPIDIGKNIIGDLPEKGQKALGRGVQLLTGMNKLSAIPGSLAGQYIEDPTQLPSLQKAIASELVSFLPGGSGIVKGGLTGLAQSVLNSFIEKGQLPELQEALSSGMLGAFLGKFLPTIGKGEGGRHAQVEDKTDYLKYRPEGPQSPSPSNIKDAEIVPLEIPSRFSPSKKKELPLIDDTRPIGQSQTQFERKYVAPIEGRKTEDITRGKTGPAIIQDYKKETITKDPFNEKIASQFKEGRGRANEFGVIDNLEKEGVLNNEALQQQSKDIAPISKGHEFGTTRSLSEESPPIPRILPPGKPTVLTQNKDKIEALRSNPTIPSFPNIENKNVIQSRKDRLDEILSQYESQLKGRNTTPATILPPGPPSHLSQIRKNIENIRKEKKEEIVEIPPPKIEEKKKETPSIPTVKTPSIPRKKIQGSNTKEEGLKAYKESLKSNIVDESYVRSIVRHEDFDKYLESAKTQREGIQAYQLAAERLLTKMGTPKEVIMKVKSKMYDMFNK